MRPFFVGLHFTGRPELALAVSCLARQGEWVDAIGALK
jgi:hypothetical protein